MDKEYIIKEIRRTAEENGGKPLGINKFESETGIKYHDWYGIYWAKWGDAIKEAGYESNVFGKSYDEEFILNKIIELIRELGKFPTWGELRLKRNRDKTFPCQSPYLKMGNKQQRAKKIIEYCQKYGDLSDVIDICLPICAHNNQVVSRDVDRTIDNFGFVYLMKSGKYYKIGMSSSAERREYELKLVLPEEPKLVHKIKTDDPGGIEAYWHKRFEEKRRGKSEFFTLTAADVKAFKRRKFM